LSIPSKSDVRVSGSSYSELRVGIIIENGAGIFMKLLTFDNYESSFNTTWDTICVTE
jgi:hypothetical protein